MHCTTVVCILAVVLIVRFNRTGFMCSVSGFVVASRDGLCLHHNLSQETDG